jgi:hypothetical protein
MDSESENVIVIDDTLQANKSERKTANKIALIGQWCKTHLALLAIVLVSQILVIALYITEILNTEDFALRIPSVGIPVYMILSLPALILMVILVLICIQAIVLDFISRFSGTVNRSFHKPSIIK